MTSGVRSSALQSVANSPASISFIFAAYLFNFDATNTLLQSFGEIPSFGPFCVHQFSYFGFKISNVRRFSAEIHADGQPYWLGIPYSVLRTP